MARLIPDNQSYRASCLKYRIKPLILVQQTIFHQTIQYLYKYSIAPNEQRANHYSHTSIEEQMVKLCATLPKSNVPLAAVRTQTNISQASPVFPGELHVTFAFR